MAAMTVLMIVVMMGPHHGFMESRVWKLKG